MHKCGRLDEQISLLKQKLRLVQQGAAFKGKSTKTGRSRGRKVQVSLKQETTRLLVHSIHTLLVLLEFCVTVVEREYNGCWQGNLGWAYMQQHEHFRVQIVYRWILIEDE